MNAKFLVGPGLAIAEISAGFAIRLCGAGWKIVPLIIPYVLLFMLHTGFAVLVLRRKTSTAALPLLAGLLSFAAFAFQTDYGDGPSRWFCISAAFGLHNESLMVPSWWFARRQPFGELILFVPPTFLWILLLRQRAITPNP